MGIPCYITVGIYYTYYTQATKLKVVKPSMVVDIQYVCLYIDLRTLREQHAMYCMPACLYARLDEKPEEPRGSGGKRWETFLRYSKRVDRVGGNIMILWLLCIRVKSFGASPSVRGHPAARSIPCLRRPVVVRRRLEWLFSMCVCVTIVSKIKIAIIAVAGSCFSAVKIGKKMFVTCANLRGRVDRKCTVICCACVLSQTTSGYHPIVSTIILCEVS